MLIHRRSVLAGAGLSALALSARAARASTPAQPRSLRVAFLTDTHLKAPDDAEHPDEHHGNRRVVAAFDAVRAARADLVVFGGDNVFAVDYKNTQASAVAQFENWIRTIRAHVAVPTLAVIGNHDIWTGEHAARHELGGKQYALKAFGMPARFYAHDAAGWRFCMLDSFHDDGCHIDDEQMRWLERQAADHDGPVCLVSHAPIITVGQFLEQKEPGVHGGYNAPRGWVVGNAADLCRLIARAGNIRLALAGHMHQVEVIDYLGCRFVDGGAVSGAWWGGTYLDRFPANVMLLDLAPDGSSAAKTVEYEHGTTP